MMSRTHAICGTTTMITIAGMQPSYLQNMSIVVLAIFSLVGSYCPDVDMLHSKLGKKFWLLAVLLKHRGITHTLLLPALLGMLVHFKLHGAGLWPEILCGIMVGWIAHIIADMFNRKGVPIFWPIFPKRVHVAAVETGTSQEIIFMILWILTHVIFVFLVRKGGLM